MGKTSCDVLQGLDVNVKCITIEVTLFKEVQNEIGPCLWLVSIGTKSSEKIFPVVISKKLFLSVRSVLV